MKNKCGMRNAECGLEASLKSAALNPQSAIRIPQSENGLVLISVLWVILVLSLVSFSLASAVRVEVTSSQQSFDSERAFFMAKGAAEVVYNVFSKNQEIPTDSPIRTENGEYVFPFASGEARVWFESAAGRIDLNAAPDKLLASMFDSIGLNEELRNRLVDSILDWRDADDVPHLYGAEVRDYVENGSVEIARPRNDAFQTVDELLLVKNMTPEIFYGGLTVDALSREYRRIPAVRELVTVQSGMDKVNPNEASIDVLAALPTMTAELAQRIVAERKQKRFVDAADLVTRVPEMFGREGTEYMSFDEQVPTMLVSRATIASSRASRTVRLLFRREQKVQFLSFNPLLYRLVKEVQFDRWRLE